MYKFIALIISIGLSASTAYASGLPSLWVRNYPVQEYNASCQNWDVAVCTHDNLYVANNSGLLTFDGNTWQTHPLPGDALITEVACHNDTVYTRGPAVQGYWTRLHSGLSEFHPMEQLPAALTFDNSTINYPIPAEIRTARPSAFASLEAYDLIGTETEGLYILNKQGEILVNLSLRNQLQDNIVHAICVQDDKRFWLALDNGLSLIHLDPPLSLLGKRSVWGKLLSAALEDDELYIQTNLGYYKKEIDSFFPFSPVSAEEALNFLPEEQAVTDRLPIDTGSLGEFAAADQIYPAPDHLYWFTRGNEAGLFHIEQGSTTLKCRLLFDNYGVNLVNRDKQFFPLNDSLYLVSAMQGILLVNTRKLIGENLGILVTPSFKRLEFSDTDGSHTLSADRDKISLPHNFRRAHVFISTGLFTPNRQISYKIEGVSSEWSEWQKEGVISFLQLPAGTYTIHVRKYSVKGPFPEIAFQIEVRPPWYNTVWAYAGYLFLFMLGLWVGVRFYLNMLRKKEEKRLERLRRDEEQKIQQEKNEWLENELRTKKNELTLQTTALVRRNEVVQSLIEELDRQKETLGDRYPAKLYTRMHSLMEKAKGDQEDWILFENYFNSAHQDFSDRLRREFTDITPGDLRVCCLLRMNLSTKEIASLLNVSIRAVELRRYRLRKRLRLEGDTNLVDFLINF